MKTFLCLSVSLIGLVTSVVTASAVDENASRITTSRSLRVASVCVLDENAHGYILQQAFSTSFAGCLSGRGKETMPVKMIAASASRAADDLMSGEFDAILVIGEQLPAVLKSNKFTSFRAVSQIGAPVHVFHLVLRNSDPAMQSALGAAFEQATSSVAFQETIGRAAAVRVVASNLER
jgi:hypothetical protein